MVFNTLFQMKFFLRILTQCVCLLFAHNLKSQQLPEFSQYTFNAFLLNPAVAGSEGYSAVNLTSRRQWMGIAGAPETDAVSFQTRLYKRNFIQRQVSIKRKYTKLPRSGRVGMGGYLFCDRAGILIRSGGQFSYAYHITKSKSQLSFGMSAGIYQFQVDVAKMQLDDKDDDVLNSNNSSIVYPDFNLGIYYTNRKFFTGLSMENILQSSVSYSTYRGNYKMYRKYNAVYGRLFEMNSFISIEISGYLKGNFISLPQLEETIKIRFYDRFWMGISYRTNNVIIGSAGFKVNRLYLGYAYDYNTKMFTNKPIGTHELMIALKLGDNTRRYRWMERY
jgi:type IX secretion system PorP/SprF family membrane protein